MLFESPTTIIFSGVSSMRSTPPPGSDCMMENTFFAENVTVEKNVQTTVSDLYSSENNCVIVERVLVISFLGSRDDNPHIKQRHL